MPSTKLGSWRSSWSPYSPLPVARAGQGGGLRSVVRKKGVSSTKQKTASSSTSHSKPRLKPSGMRSGLLGTANHFQNHCPSPMFGSIRGFPSNTRRRCTRTARQLTSAWNRAPSPPTRAWNTSTFSRRGRGFRGCHPSTPSSMTTRSSPFRLVEMRRPSSSSTSPRERACWTMWQFPGAAAKRSI